MTSMKGQLIILPQKNYFGPQIGGLWGPGAPLIGPTFPTFHTFPTFPTFNTIPTCPIFPTFSVWPAQGVSKNISHLGVRDIKSPPSFKPPKRAPLWRSRGVRDWGVGDSPRNTNMILEVKCFPNIFDSIGFRRVNQTYPQKNILAPLTRGVRGVSGTFNQPTSSNFMRDLESQKIFWVKGRLII